MLRAALIRVAHFRDLEDLLGVLRPFLVDRQGAVERRSKIREREAESGHHAAKVAYKE